jgi:dimethylamine monooxygenase subunit A
VLFTIRTYVERLAEALDGPASAAALAARIREMPEAMARYKSIAPIRSSLLVWLDSRASEKRT